MIQTMSTQHVVIFGASPKPARYANQAQRLLTQHGHRVTPVHPKFPEIDGLQVTHQLGDITEAVDTLTLYVGTDRLVEHIDSIVSLKPGRVIFNPGTESEPLQSALDAANIEWFEACTLVMLKTDQF